MVKKKYKINLVSILLPTYNEVENIVDLIKEIQRVVRTSKEIIVVDDNSPDETSKKVSNWMKASKDKKIRLEIRKSDRGLTNSIKRAIELAKGDVIVWMDCDFSMPPAVINKLLEKIEEGYDISVGSRFIKGGHFKRTETGKKDSAAAIILSRGMNYAIQFILGGSFKDYTSGFVAVRRKVFEKVLLRGDYGEYFIDFIYKSLCYKFKVVEIPYTCLPRLKGESKTGSNIWQYLKRGKKYITLTFRLIYEKHILRSIP